MTQGRIHRPDNEIPNSPSIKFLSMSDLANLPPPKWLIQNVIPDHGFGILVGPPSSGKSFFLHELGQAVSRNTPLFGDSSLVPERTGWVIAFLPEASKSWAARMRAFCSHYEVPYSNDFVFSTQPHDLCDKGTWDQIVAAITNEAKKRGELPVLVIIDTLSASIPGRDENSQAEMTRLTSNLQILVNMGICIIVAHHTSKSNRYYRGSSVLLGSCDWMLSIVQSKHIRELVAVKLRDADCIRNVAFEIQSVDSSGVCVLTDGGGPWGLYETIGKDHPGLIIALKSFGFQSPNDDNNDVGNIEICVDGVKLTSILHKWVQLDPITPSNSEDSAAYKANHGSRVTVLLRLADALWRGGVLTVVNGVISKKSRDLQVVVKQVSANDD
ncbi:MAG: AAA family ATPase [Candidatus Krumholzibacteriia bacterium]